MFFCGIAPNGGGNRAAMTTTGLPIMSLRGGEADAAIRSFGSLFLCALPARGTDCQKVNCPAGAREATLGCGPDGPRNDIRCTIVPLKSVPEGDTSILHSSFFILHFSTPPVDCGENPVHNRIWLSPSTAPCGKRLFYPHSPVDGNPLNLLASTGFST